MSDIINYPLGDRSAGFSVDKNANVSAAGNITGGGLITNTPLAVDGTGGATIAITPTSSVVTFTCDETVTALTIGVPLAAGQRLTLINLSAFAATVADTNVQQATTVLNQYDAAEYVAISTSAWVQISLNDNTPS